MNYLDKVIINDDEMVKSWLVNMFNTEINTVNNTIANEHIAELGFIGEEFDNYCDESDNYHTKNIIRYEKYVRILKKLLKIAKKL